MLSLSDVLPTNSKSIVSPALEPNQAPPDCDAVLLVRLHEFRDVNVLKSAKIAPPLLKQILPVKLLLLRESSLNGRTRIAPPREVALQDR